MSWSIFVRTGTRNHLELGIGTGQGLLGQGPVRPAGQFSRRQLGIAELGPPQGLANLR